MTLNVFEIRNYLLQPHMREHFIDYFEANFITTQTAVNMHVLGQFRLLGEPDHYVWIRGFTDMQSRSDGLQGFYEGPVWKKHRTTTNSMIIDSDNVHLLRPLDANLDLTCGQSAKTVATALADSSISPHTGLIAIDIYQATSGKRDALIDAFQTQITPIYQSEGVQLRGLFVAEMSENTYPRLPAFQNADEFVVITAYPDVEQGQSTHARLAPTITQS
ncbi:MAG: NIPSNAP family protein, partial [Anaerolineae bacterium]|nr:NIPSNAP family protein [Anaerolineae bacterium]